MDYRKFFIGLLLIIAFTLFLHEAEAWICLDCVGSVKTTCLGNVDGRVVPTGELVTCQLLGSPRLSCKFNILNPFSFCDDSEPCAGVTSNYQPCVQINGTKGCKGASKDMLLHVFY